MLFRSRLCPDCITEYSLDTKELKTIEDNFNINELLEFLEKSEELKGKIKANAKWGDVKFYRSRGCEHCNNEGYHGRMGIYEVLEINEDIEKLITQAASTETIENKARENGMATMIEDGFVKAVQGSTSIEEILRVTKE